ncbi:M15 family metallopeptidase [Gordonia sp. PDNC005]|uniref:M15 family metallopeptidase n=1 Tax=unclassified Gordonia (in: high G+C Gram-positive bacteria) TaxID=2657482 RepID=UPI00196269E5|nr:M15 family metallopeptidase [Gordonia sp. PDNC005]QRY63652.1 M15 family metallopeptidase [Gordonia sp. PDNC005]
MTTRIVRLLSVAAVSVSLVLASTACRMDDITRSFVDTSDNGSLPDEGVTVDSTSAAITRLDPDLLDALRRAVADARAQNVDIRITSGWRSRDFQQSLFADAVGTYGSEDAASRFVASPDKSKHVTGEAVDVGPTDAMDWMSRNGSDYGLCQIFANELWHYELVPGGDCPDLLPDASAL